MDTQKPKNDQRRRSRTPRGKGDGIWPAIRNHPWQFLALVVAIFVLARLVVSDGESPATVKNEVFRKTPTGGSLSSVIRNPIELESPVPGFITGSNKIRVTGRVLETNVTSLVARVAGDVNTSDRKVALAARKSFDFDLALPPQEGEYVLEIEDELERLLLSRRFRIDRTPPVVLEDPKTVGHPPVDCDQGIEWRFAFSEPVTLFYENGVKAGALTTGQGVVRIAGFDGLGHEPTSVMVRLAVRDYSGNEMALGLETQCYSLRALKDHLCALRPDADGRWRSIDEEMRLAELQAWENLVDQHALLPIPTRNDLLQDPTWVETKSQFLKTLERTVTVTLREEKSRIRLREFRLRSTWHQFRNAMIVGYVQGSHKKKSTYIDKLPLEVQGGKTEVELSHVRVLHSHPGQRWSGLDALGNPWYSWRASVELTSGTRIDGMLKGEFRFSSGGFDNCVYTTFELEGLTGEGLKMEIPMGNISKIEFYRP